MELNSRGQKLSGISSNLFLGAVASILGLPLKRIGYYHLWRMSISSWIIDYSC